MNLQYRQKSAALLSLMELYREFQLIVQAVRQRNFQQAAVFSKNVENKTHCTIPAQHQIVD